MTAQEAREKYRLFVYGGGRIKENQPIDLSEYVRPADADEGTGFYVCTVPKKITVSKEMVIPYMMLPPILTQKANSHCFSSSRN